MSKNEEPATAETVDGLSEFAQAGTARGSEPTAQARAAQGDGDHVVGLIEKNGREQVRVALRAYKGVQLVDVRIYYLAEGDELRPTSKGVSLKIGKIGELIAGLQAAEAEARRRGLIGGGA